ncbi:hypothetical protein [Brevibacillus marinus]|uniref:hypothetical protein n=1 Tax=Brevibacillus marinus TaxID=2496837 RepID=UPI000F83D543|nr:hypothetical protein [Brevibacillus marinus]
MEQLEPLKLVECKECRVTFCIPKTDHHCPECKSSRLKVLKTNIIFPEGYVDWQAFKNKEGICYINRYHQPFTYQQMLTLANGDHKMVERLLVLGEVSGVSVHTLLIEIQTDRVLEGIS